jgi:hypothetical protein
MDYIHINQFNEGMDQDDNAPLVDTFGVKEALLNLSTAKALEEEAKALREKALEVLAPFHYATGARAFSMPGVGKCSTYQGVNTRTDHKKVYQGLVERGVDAGLIEECRESATTSKYNEKITVKFTPER